MINVNDVKGFLTYLAVDKTVSASSQNLGRTYTMLTTSGGIISILNDKDG
jgi:hypothetical protein